MPNAKFTWLKPVQAVLRKDMVCEFRVHYAMGTVCMFALVTLSSISMSLGGMRLTPILAAVFLWVIIFFSAMAGLSRVFVQEQEAGTHFTLRVYASPQTVLFGKLAFNLLMLLGLTALVIPLFVVFFDVEVTGWLVLSSVLLLGDIGIAAVATLTAAMSAGSQGQGALFTVLTFPVALPQFLTAIQATETAFAGFPLDINQLLFMAGYDAAIIAAVSILFDYLWYD